MPIKRVSLLLARIEQFLQSSEAHHNDLWFAWGLLDLRVHTLQGLWDSADVSADGLGTWTLNVDLLLSDFIHVFDCVERLPSSSTENSALQVYLRRRMQTAIWGIKNVDFHAFAGRKRKYSE